MTVCTFSLDSYEIKDTRAAHEDTNYVSVSLSVNGGMIGAPQTKFMGNQNNGTYQVGLSFPNVDIPGDATVCMWYSIINNGHGNHADVERTITESVSDSSPTGDFWVTLGKYLAKIGLSLVFADCDGPITPKDGRKLIWSTDELKGIAPGTKFEDTQIEPGNDSPHGCGSNSRYLVHYTVTAIA